TGRYLKSNFLNEITNQIEKNQYDFLVFDGFLSGIFLPELKRKTNIPLLYRAHNVEHHIWHLQANQHTALKKRYLHFESEKVKQFEIKIAKNADAILAISGSDKNYF